MRGLRQLIADCRGRYCGETFREEAERLEERIFAGTSTRNRYKVEERLPVE